MRENNIELLKKNLNKDIKFISLKSSLQDIKQRYGLSYFEIIAEIENNIMVPLDIFVKELAPLETICKFLKENQGLSNIKIAKLLQRSEKTIWKTYYNVKIKYPRKFELFESKYPIPVSEFSDRKFSILEKISFILKEKYNLTFHEIALLLKRDDRTIWTVYNRLKKKQNGKN